MNGATLCMVPVTMGQKAAPKHIGYLCNNNVVLCNICVREGAALDHGPELVKLYPENVHPYSAFCHKCRRELYKGGKGEWPELYSCNEEKADTARSY